VFISCIYSQLKNFMGFAKDNYVTSGASGDVGTLWSFRQRAGRTVIAKVRAANSKAPTDKVLAVRDRFKTAFAYAQSVMKKPDLKAEYAAAAPRGVSAFNLALGDAAQSPVVSKIDTTNYHGVVGNTLVIDATDNFKVARVVVTIDSAAGALIETGNAVMDENKNWIYTATAANAAIAGSKISAVASDLPGNTGTLSVTL
jgi:hypothetical protein